MIRSLIKQLSEQSANTLRVLESLFVSKMGGKQQPTTAELLTTLREMVQEFDETFTILDALDECEDRHKLLTNIKKMVGWNSEKLHILAASRKENDIKEWLESLVNDKEKICIQNALINDDICTYVHERLRTDHRLKRWQKPEEQQKIEKTLMDRADGM